MKKLTPWFIAITVGIIAVYDIWVILEYGNEESISAHILTMGFYIPQVPLSLGYIFGHLTFPKKIDKNYRDKIMPWSIGISAVVMYLGIIDVYQLYWGGGLDALIFGGKEFKQPVFFILGYILGHYLWPMPQDKWKNRFKE